MLDVNGSEILDINTGGIIISVSRDTLTLIKGTRLEALFSGKCDKRLPRDSDGRLFLDVHPKCFLAVVDYLIDCKIAPPDCPPKMPHLGEEDDTLLQQLLLVFGLRDVGMEKSKRLIGKTKLGQAHDDSDEDSEKSEVKWKVMKFDNLPKETPRSIQRVLKEEQKALLAANNELVEQRLLFEEENTNIRVFLGK